MRILQVNWTDLVGQAFNGFNLNLELNKRGFESQQLVLKKESNEQSVVEIDYDETLHNEISYLEKSEAVTDILYPYAKKIADMECFKEADIVHYHILHGMISLFDYKYLMSLKPSVMTIHDLWPFTGKCTYPLSCEKWKNGCDSCDRENEIFFSQKIDNAKQMWEIKQKVYSQINPYFILGSEYTRFYFINSSVFKGKKNQIIPFGVQCELFDVTQKKRIRKRLGFDENKVIIGFRCENYSIKGCSYLYEALQTMKEMKNQIALLCIGSGDVPDYIKQSFELHEYGWVSDTLLKNELLVACDIFVMPSLAETFGLMAIEAMAAENVTVCFSGTVLKEVTNAPEIGISVDRISSDDLGKELKSICVNDKERISRAKKGRKFAEEKYKLETYVNAHVSLYERILKGE